jgi:hypothetical protein
MEAFTMEKFRQLVRPLLTIVGFGAVVALALKLGFQFADREIALLIIGEFIGMVLTMIAWWFKERSEKASES